MGTVITRIFSSMFSTELQSKIISGNPQLSISAASSKTQTTLKRYKLQYIIVYKVQRNKNEKAS